MTTTPPTVTQALDAMDRGALGAEELVSQCLARIDAREPAVQAWDRVLRDESLQAAREADAERRAGHDRARRPLLGIPVGIKDIIDTAGIVTGLGSPLYRDRVAAWDANCVALLRRAGAIVLGKTVSTEFAYFHAGKTRNPHAPDRSPGGSSSGSAAAVADGMVPLALGSQTAASLVRPSSFCGIWGYKASGGHLGLGGIRPLSESFDSLGVMARSAADLALARQVLRGVPVRPAQAGRRWRIGVADPGPWKSRGPEATAALRAAQGALGGVADIERVDLDELLQEALVHHRTVMAFEAARNYAYEYDRYRGQLSPAFIQLLEEGAQVGDDAMRDASHRLAEAERGLAGLWSRVDAVLTLCADGVAPLLANGTGDATFGRVWTALNCCAVALPAAVTAEGLPVGLQLTGPRGADDRLLECAVALDGALALPYAV